MTQLCCDQRAGEAGGTARGGGDRARTDAFRYAPRAQGPGLHRCGLRRRGLLLGLGGLAFLLAIQLPGLLELYRFVPLVGLGATVRFAPVAALALGLVAGHALEVAPLRARLAGVAVLLPLIGGALYPPGPPALEDDAPAHHSGHTRLACLAGQACAHRIQV